MNNDLQRKFGLLGFIFGVLLWWGGCTGFSGPGKDIYGQSLIGNFITFILISGVVGAFVGAKISSFFIKKGDK